MVGCLLISFMMTVKVFAIHILIFSPLLVKRLKDGMPVGTGRELLSYLLSCTIQTSRRVWLKSEDCKHDLRAGITWNYSATRQMTGDSVKNIFTRTYHTTQILIQKGI